MNDIISFRKCLSLLLALLLIDVIIIPSINSVEVNPTILTFCKGNILYVGGSGLENYSSIQEAINDAVDGDTVFVYDDSSPYYENISITKSISLIGEDKNTTIINGNDAEAIIRITVDSVTVENFHITNGFSGILLFHSNYTIISNNIFKGYLGRSIEVWESYNNLVIGNYIDGNDSEISTAIYIQEGGYHTITENTIINMHYTGIYTLYSDNNIFSNNIITYSNGLQGIAIQSSHNNSIVSNTVNVYGQREGRIHPSVALFVSDSNTIHGNILTSFNGEGVVGLRVRGWKNVITNNSIYSFSFLGIELISDPLRNQNIISNNNIVNNSNGIIVSGNFNQITHNNFINNSHNAFFFDYTFKNRWDNNYWDKARSNPYPIIGRVFLAIIPWINFDWNPAQEPYDIGV